MRPNRACHMGLSHGSVTCPSSRMATQQAQGSAARSNSQEAQCDSEGSSRWDQRQPCHISYDLTSLADVCNLQGSGRAHVGACCVRRLAGRQALAGECLYLDFVCTPVLQCQEHMSAATGLNWHAEPRLHLMMQALAAVAT
jgi:hypothetical protein